MKKSFPERAAHLSYTAPLMAALFMLQFREADGSVDAAAAILVGLVLLGGAFAGVTGLRWFRSEQGRLSPVAVLGTALNLASLVALAIWWWTRGG
jgi:hypothetical protein